MKKNTIRLIILCLTLVSFIFSLASCHGAKGLDAFVIPEEFDSSENYEITFWAKNDTNKVQSAIYMKAISDFEALYPNIKVNIRLYTDYSRIYNDVITNIATNTTPNVCITYPDNIATYMTGTNVVVPLDDLFVDEKFGFGGSEIRFDSPAKDEIIPEFLDECAFFGSYYAIPFMRSTEACYVNKTYVEKLGFKLPETLTWDFVFEVADAATEKDAEGNYIVNGQKVMIPFIYKSTDNMMIQMLAQKGTGYSTPEGDILIFNNETESILFDLADHVKKGSFSTFKISSYPANFLNAGQCIFAIDSTAGATWMGSKAPLLDISEDKLVEFETAVMTVPQYDPENPKMISQGPSVCIFNKENDQEVLASWMFAQYLLTNDVQIAYAETEGYVPVTSKARDTAEYIDYLSKEGADGEEHYEIKLKATKLLLENTENTFVTPVFNGSASLRDAAGQLIENVTKSVRRKEVIDKNYMIKLFSDTTSLYRLNQLSAGGGNGEKSELGALPVEAVIMIVTLIVVWIGIGAYVLIERIKAKKNS